MELSPKNPAVSIVIPVYGGERTLEALVEGLRGSLEAAGLTFELLLVCDRPRDGSWAIASRLASSDRRVAAVLLGQNYGQHPATLLGIRMAQGTTIVTMDEDLQHSPEEVPRLVVASRASGGIVYGVASRLQHGAWRNFTSRSAKRFLARFVGFSAATDLSAFRAFPARLRDAFERYEGRNVAIDVLLSWSGAATSTMTCEHAPRQGGASGYTLRKLVNYMLDLTVGYSTAPLRVASALGLLSVVVAMLVGLFIVANYLVRGSVVPGFAFIALSVAMFSGVQLLSIGVMGEYLGRLYENSLRKPQYTVESVVRAEQG
jgi:undecaprenyl-phosphate 4-deoxy-4-formamido-L-arabinose transferase